MAKLYKVDQKVFLLHKEELPILKYPYRSLDQYIMEPCHILDDFHIREQRSVFMNLLQYSKLDRSAF